MDFRKRATHLPKETVVREDSQWSVPKISFPELLTLEQIRLGQD